MTTLSECDGIKLLLCAPLCTPNSFHAIIHKGRWASRSVGREGPTAHWDTAFATPGSPQHSPGQQLPPGGTGTTLLAWMWTFGVAQNHILGHQGSAGETGAASAQPSITNFALPGTPKHRAADIPLCGSTLREEPRGIRFCWWGHRPREFPLLDSRDPQLQRRWVLGAASPSQRLGSSFAQQGSALPCFPEKRETKEEEGEGSFFLLKGTSSNFLGGEKPYSEGKNTQWSRSPSNPQQCMGKEQSCLPAHPEPLDSGRQPCTGLQGTEPVGAAAKPSVGSGG